MSDTRIKARRNVALDLHALHRILWRMSDSRHRLTVHQGKLARELDINQVTMSRLLTRMCDTGQLKNLGRTGAHNLYVVSEPADPSVLAEPRCEHCGHLLNP